MKKIKVIVEFTDMPGVFDAATETRIPFTQKEADEYIEEILERISDTEEFKFKVINRGSNEKN